MKHVVRGMIPQAEGPYKTCRWWRKRRLECLKENLVNPTCIGHIQSKQKVQQFFPLRAHPLSQFKETNGLYLICQVHHKTHPYGTTPPWGFLRTTQRGCVALVFVEGTITTQNMLGEVGVSETHQECFEKDDKIIWYDLDPPPSQ